VTRPEREAFEKWCHREPGDHDLSVANDGQYRNLFTRVFWLVWLAATEAERERLRTALMNSMVETVDEYSDDSIILSDDRERLELLIKRWVAAAIREAE